MGHRLTDIMDHCEGLYKGLKEADEEILYYKKVLDGSLDACIKKNKEIKSLKSNLEDSDKRIFKLEQQIRTLNIQLEEEKEINADLEIENIKLKKQIVSLKKSLESVNNNCYDLELNDNSVISNLESTLEEEEVNGDTVLGNTNPYDVSEIPILSNSMMNDSRFDSTSMLLTTPSIVLVKSTAKKPSRPCGAPKTIKPIIDSNTITKKVSMSTSTFTKKARRRSKSVDFQVGEKTVIEPQLCELCLSKSQMRGTNDSPTLPWCPHGGSLSSTTSSASLLATPSRTLFKSRLNPSGIQTSTPAPRSILKGGSKNLLELVRTRH